MATCSCAGATCNCVIQPGAGIAVTGAGSASNPYVVSSSQGAAGPGGRIPGEMVPYAGSTPPPGWLLCNGQAVSRTAYPDLFTAIGTKWGSGDGANTFNVPSMTDRYPYGASSSRPLGTTGGSASLVLSAAQLPPHNHPIPHTHPHAHSHPIDHDHGTVNTSDVNVGIRAAPYAKSDTGTTAVADNNTYAHHHSVNLPLFKGNSGRESAAATGGTNTPNSSNTGNGSAAPILPPYAAVNFLIKT